LATASRISGPSGSTGCNSGVHGGACNPTHLTRDNVVGVQRRTEAEALMKEMEDRGHGHRDVRTAANHHKVTWFIAKHDESGQVGSNRVP
jgi:hypothetical protein